MMKNNKTKSSKLKTRFAPSPTGSLHIGGLRTAVYAYALSKHSGGDFVLRIEDTDQKRLVPGATEKLKVTLNIFGLDWDEYYIQSERAKQGIYKKEAERLIESGYAFYCQCSAKNAKSEGYSNVLRDPCRDKKLSEGAIKLKVPDKEKISYTDFVIGKEIIWDTSTIADTTLLKTDTFPTYHLGVVVDDHLMSITHILRGHDWLPSTPIHLLVYKYLGFDKPQIGHLTDILDPDGGKLSKRKGSYSCEEMLADGYLPEAIFNFVILLGWAPKNNRELFTLSEFVKYFDPKGLQKSNPVFDRNKLDWFNGYYIRQKSVDELLVLLKPFVSENVSDDNLKKIITLVKDRIKKLSEFEDFAGQLYLAKKKDPISITSNFVSNISNATISLEKIPENNWNLGNINESLGKAQIKSGSSVRDFYMDLRGTIFGSSVTPPVNESLEILGKPETIKQLKKVGKK